MSISLISAGAITNAGSATQVTPSFGVATTAGHFLVGRAGFQSNGTPFITGATGWTVAVFQTASLLHTTVIFWKENCGASETAPTINANTGGELMAQVSEYEGVATSSPFDQWVTGTSKDTATPTADAADAAAGNLVIAVAYGVGSKTTTWSGSSLWTPSGGTEWETFLSSGKSQYAMFAGSYVTSSNAVADSDAITLTPGTGSATIWSGLASFKPGPAVTVTGLSPTSGIPGTSVAVTGTLFTGATDVTFGGVSASSFTVNSDTSITATAPAGVSGVVDVQVHITAGVSPGSSGSKFTYLPNARPVVVLNQAINRASRW